MPERKLTKQQPILDLARHLGELRPKEEWGAVAILDALGTRDGDMRAAWNFIEVRKIIINDLESEAARYMKQTTVMTQELAETLDFDIRSFGDTLLISAGFPAEDDEDDERTKAALALVSLVASAAVYHGIQSSLLFRGSIASGYFIKDEAAILGPCITDAASWYEKTDWVGVTLTPRTALAWGHEFDGVWAEYKVPVKRGSGNVELIPLHALTWAEIHIAMNGYESVLKDCTRAFSAHPIPFGSESKARHTLAFMEFMRDRVTARLAALAKGKKRKKRVTSVR